MNSCGLRRKKALRFFFVVLLGTSVPVWLSPFATAQALSSIGGSVSDPTGALVTGARVTVKNLDTGMERNGLTDSSGEYHAMSLPAGDYQVIVSKQGFSAAKRIGIHLAVGQDAEVDIGLKPKGAQQQVVVNADASAVSLTTADISGLVSGRQIKDLPLNGRSYDELLTLNPGIVNFTFEKTGGVGVTNSTVGNNFSVSGNRPQQNLFLLNGMEFTGAAENNMQPGGTSQQLLGVDSVREFNVLRDDYGAEYGKRPGAQVLIVTQGGDEHASRVGITSSCATMYWMPGTISTKARRTAIPTQPVRRCRWVDRSGRIRPSRLETLKALRQHLHQTGVALVPDINARAGMLPCKLVTPAPNPCPASGLVNVGVAPVGGPAAQFVANAQRGFAGLRRHRGGIQQPAANHSRRLWDGRLDQEFSSQDTLSGVYTSTIATT